jgi:hypothetical protein
MKKDSICSSYIQLSAAHRRVGRHDATVRQGKIHRTNTPLYSSSERVRTNYYSLMMLTFGYIAALVLFYFVHSVVRNHWSTILCENSVLLQRYMLGWISFT